MSVIFEVIDPLGNIIVLTEERWMHIIDQHPELADNLDMVRLTLIEPNVIQELEPESELRYYRLCPEIISRGYLFVAVIKAHNNFVATAFPIRYIRKEGELKWLKR
ncbi:hypothetical protein FJZ31_13440 [Candidatus Poribacteria bacterium]|nr:hypothetical protein [Candidatus Poribacteria bacterium]